MALSRIDIRNLRVLEAVSLLPGPGLNLLAGRNGAGKTSVLEGIFLLGRGRSFRSPRLSTVVREGERCVEVTGWRPQPGGCVGGIRRCPDKTEIRIDGKAVGKVSALARAFPVQLVTPRSHELLEQGPDLRRRFLDWGVFHVEHGFLEVASRYGRVLRQRNEALKTAQAVAFVWDDQLAALGEEIAKARERYWALLESSYGAVARVLGAPLEVVFSLSRGWARGLTLGEALGRKKDIDRQLGHTSVGPHRADLEFRLGSLPASARLSRGQQKALVLALILAQMELIAETTARRPILLVDDLAAELDEASRARVVGFLRTMRGQSFVTCLDEVLLRPSTEDRMFHVEQGRLSV